MVWFFPLKDTNMTAKITLDKAGRISIPRSLRSRLQLEPGDKLELESHGEQITLRPVRAVMPICREDGVWVYRSGQRCAVSIRKLIEEGREERHRSILGSDR